MAGYSGKPLAEKLGVKPGAEVALLHAPRDFPKALEPLPPDVRVRRSASQTASIVLLFASEEAVLSREVPRVVAALPQGGMLWIAWPKKASRQPTDLTEDVVRRVGLQAGVVDVKVCAIDETWSGLKFLRRRAPAA